MWHHGSLTLHHADCKKEMSETLQHEDPAAAEKPGCLLFAAGCLLFAVNVRNVEQKVHISQLFWVWNPKASHGALIAQTLFLLFTRSYTAEIPLWIGSCTKLRYVLHLCNTVTLEIWHKNLYFPPGLPMYIRKWLLRALWFTLCTHWCMCSAVLFVLRENFTAEEIKHTCLSMWKICYI